MKLMQTLFGQSDDLAEVRDALDTADQVTSVEPWMHVASLAVGGLVSLGFERSNETLLVTSSSGQSVIDATTGTTLYRNRDADGFDATMLKATRLDHPAAERVDMAGIYGGALPTGTSDGWTIDKLSPTWPETHCILHPPGSSIYFLKSNWEHRNKSASFHLLARELEDIRAFGFSWTGRSLVLATSSSLRIWARPAPLHLM